MGRPITNMSNYFSLYHYAILIKLARQVRDYFIHDYWLWRNLDINELINVGWFRQARYWEDMSKHILDTKREMFKWAFNEQKKVIPQLLDEENVLKVF